MKTTIQLLLALANLFNPIFGFAQYSSVRGLGLGKPSIISPFKTHNCIGSAVNLKTKANNCSFVSTFAGNGRIGNVLGRDSIAQFGGLEGIIIDNKVYIVDFVNNQIKIIYNNGTVAGFAGLGNIPHGANCLISPVPAISSYLCGPYGLAKDSSHNIYFTTSQHLFKISNSGILSRLAGDTLHSTYGYMNGTAENAILNDPVGLVPDNKGNIFFADMGNNCIRKLDSSGMVTTFAGSS